MDEVDCWLSVEEIAIHLGMFKETIYRWVDKKKIPSHKIGRQWRFKISEVDGWGRSGSSIEINQVTTDKEEIRQ